jgi:hypothetical protein
MSSPDDTQAQPDYPVTITEFEFEGKQYVLIAEAENDEYINDRFQVHEYGSISYALAMEHNNHE